MNNKQNPLDICPDPVDRHAALRAADVSGKPFKSFGEALKWGMIAAGVVVTTVVGISSLSK